MDPGIGFAKDLDANLTLIKNCKKICNSEFPVMMALSRKSFLEKLTGNAVDNSSPVIGFKIETVSPFL